MTKQFIDYDSDMDTPYDVVPSTPGVYSIRNVNTGKVDKVLTVCGESKTDQSYKEMTSVKSQVKKAEMKGLLRANNKFEGEMDDFPDYDFQGAAFMMAKAKSMYESLPSSIRNRFSAPEHFMEFANNPNNQQEMIKMGLSKAMDGYDNQGNPIPQQSVSETATPAEPTTPQAS